MIDCLKAFIPAAIIILLSCQPTPGPEQQHAVSEKKLSSDTLSDQKSIHPATLLTHADAELILGEPVMLSDSISTFGPSSFQFKSTYAALTEAEPGKKGNLYFLIEEFREVSEAEITYASIKESNEGHEGITVLAGVGDEAYYHTDGQNFSFILVRKANRMFRIKVNKLTSKTSPDDFNRVARRIAESI